MPESVLVPILQEDEICAVASWEHRGADQRISRTFMEKEV